METVRTPCIGICSTTSFGDLVCRGCKRYSFEVISWNSYTDQQKQAALNRIEILNTQILERKLRIVSIPKLEQALKDFKIPFDPALSPYCWLHNLLKRAHQKLTDLDQIGVRKEPEASHLSIAELTEVVDAEILTLIDAHYARYIDRARFRPESA